MTELTIDGRRARGDLTRRRVALSAASIATVSGLDSISVSQLADDTGLSKSGILTVFQSREAIQLAAVEEARKVVLSRVIAPAWNATPGRPRLRKIVDNWFTYVEIRVFPGGCFLVATASEYATQQGPVADAVAELKRSWIALIEDELAEGLPRTKAARRSARETAFTLDSWMAMGSVRYHLLGDVEDLVLARSLCHRLLRRTD